MSWKQYAAQAMILGSMAALSARAQTPQAGNIPTTPDAPCAPEPTNAPLDTTGTGAPDSEGFFSLFDGSISTWTASNFWQSCLTGHSSADRANGAVFRIGEIHNKLDPNKPYGIYSTQRTSGGQGIGGILMTKKKYLNYEIILDIWPDYGNDGGLFNRTTANGVCFQTVLDYIGGASVGGTWAEAGYSGKSRDFRPFSFASSEKTISIPGNTAGELSNWTLITQKLKATTEPNLPCPATGCTQTEWQALWDFDGWNQVRIKFYGGSGGKTKAVHMKSWFRKAGATVWVPVIQDTTQDYYTTPAGYIGLQVHGGNRFNAPNGTWYRSVKWRPLDEDGNPKVVVSTKKPEPAMKFGYSLTMKHGMVVGSIDSDYEIQVQDLKGRTFETFSGKAGAVTYALRSAAAGELNLRIRTARGVERTRVIRDAR